MKEPTLFPPISKKEAAWLRPCPATGAVIPSIEISAHSTVRRSRERAGGLLAPCVLSGLLGRWSRLG
jgi:hypothetical protein